MDSKKDPMEILRQEVSDSKMLDCFFHQLVKEKGGISAEDIREFITNYVMKHSDTETLVDELDLEHVRACSECGKPMYEGFCIENGAEYYCSEECLHKHLTEEEYENLYDDGNGDSYWTSWLD